MWSAMPSPAWKETFRSSSASKAGCDGSRGSASLAARSRFQSSSPSREEVPLGKPLSARPADGDPAGIHAE